MSQVQGVGRFALVFGGSALWLVAAGVGLWSAAAQRDARVAAPAPERGKAEMVGAGDCARCHAEQHASWASSYHRTMTQALAPSLDQSAPVPVRAAAPNRGPAELLAPFAGEQLHYGGFVATMDRDEQGAPRITVRAEASGTAEPLLRATVVMTVGSHRYQQYLGALPTDPLGTFSRLPVAWHRAEARWIHLNGAFVEPEGAEGDPKAYLRHVTRWNDNCLFCHNTEPSPGLESGRFDTSVGELGIACEACHGKGALHTQAHANPFERMLARGQADATIADPLRMSAAREADVCGRCHGNRIARDIQSVLREGDGFVPGEALSKHSRPILADARLQGTEGTPFSARFWPDKSPRLSAYEYQAMQMSACHSEGELRCGDCHTMHGDEPDMQLRAGSRVDACARCHATQQLSASQGAGGHGAHMGLDAARTPDCVDCHMPRTTYGLLEGMVSHWIRSPNPRAALGRHDQPDACTQCHVDASRAWADKAMPALRRGELADLDDPQVAQVARDLFGGDALQRNLAAHAVARPLATGDPKARLQLLVAALDDTYPSVRWFAWRGARSLAAALADVDPSFEAVHAQLKAFDYLAPAQQRVSEVHAIRAALGSPGFAAFRLGAPHSEALERAANDEGLWIGE